MNLVQAVGRECSPLRHTEHTDLGSALCSLSPPHFLSVRSLPPRRPGNSVRFSSNTANAPRLSSREASVRLRSTEQTVGSFRTASAVSTDDSNWITPAAESVRVTMAPHASTYLWTSSMSYRSLTNAL